MLSNVLKLLDPKGEQSELFMPTNKEKKIPKLFFYASEGKVRDLAEYKEI